MQLSEYCRPFISANKPWPKFPLPIEASITWWQNWIIRTPPINYFSALRNELPQLWIMPREGASSSEVYKRLVLKGEVPNPSDRDSALHLNDPGGFVVSLVDHPCGTFPVIDINDQIDFLNVVRCLAYKCELESIQESVHAQAVSGLIHWGLIKMINKNERSQLIILHNAPYSSLQESVVPGRPTWNQWLLLSRRWRLEHELTHLATKLLAGEMRLNLFDELIADTLGMLFAIDTFSADLFIKGLGINVDGNLNEGGRCHTYIKQLEQKDSQAAIKFVVDRAYELEELLSTGLLRSERLPLLKYLIRQQLDKTFLVASC